MWSNSQYTLCTTSNDWNFVGELNNNINNNRLCDVVNLEAGELTLYAKATYTGTIHVALSFMHSDGKRYFLTHPGAEAPRYSRARPYR